MRFDFEKAVGVFNRSGAKSDADTATDINNDFILMFEVLINRIEALEKKVAAHDEGVTRRDPMD